MAGHSHSAIFTSCLPFETPRVLPNVEMKTLSRHKIPHQFDAVKDILQPHVRHQQIVKGR